MSLQSTPKGNSNASSDPDSNINHANSPEAATTINAEPKEDDEIACEVRALTKAKDVGAALALIDRHLPDDGRMSQTQLLLRAELLGDAGQHDSGDLLFERMITSASEADVGDIRIIYTKRLRKRGLIVRADEVMEAVRSDPKARKGARALAAEISEIVVLLRRLEPVRLTREVDARILSLHHAILMFRGRQLRQREGGSTGKISLITGSLGPGGAERQIARIASNLEEAYRNGTTPDGIRVDRSVEVIVKSLKSDPMNAFFAPDVIAAGAGIVELDDIPVTHPAIDLPESEAADLTRLLKLLPPPANYGVGRLTQHLVDGGTDVASIWQDGACLFAGLSALIAGVPTIHLSFRGLPPIIRQHMFRPEYETLYRALASVPGVHLHCNSKVTAREYANWLDLPEERFEVIYNGVPEVNLVGTSSEAERMAQFRAKTPDATRTVGGVFRLDTDKRPMLWVKLAARYFKRRGDTRFIIVGAGRMMAQAQALAHELGLGQNILFVGNSFEVGYWMAQMDVVLLMSRYEGLPNVLIEAQMAGAAVVSTPAGGASECFIEGTTGRILDQAETPDLDNACDCIDAMVAAMTGDERQARSQIAKAYAADKFSVARMIGQFARSCITDDVHHDQERAAA